MKNTFIKLLALMLCIVMLGSALVSCKGTDGDETESPDGTTSSVNAGDADDGEKSAIEDANLPERDYSGETFVIRYATKTTFIPDTLNASSLDASKNTVKKAGYDRDLVFEDMFGAEISYIVSETNPNDFYGSDSEIVSIRTLHQSGELSEIDMLCVGARTAGTMIAESMLMDLNDYSNYIKPNSYYYSKGVNEQTSIGGKAFVASGYHTTMNVSFMSSICVNNTILSDHFQDSKKIDELYDLAINHKWTMEKMFEYGKNYASGPIEQDTTVDTYTLVVGLNPIASFFSALGGTVVEKDENELPVVTINNTSNIDILTYLKGKMVGNYAAYLAPNDTELETFTHKKSMFLQSALLGVSGMDEYGIDGRLMPLPIRNEGDEYVGDLPAWDANVVSIPASVADADMAAYLLEAFMALSYDFVYPEFYEKLFKTRYSENEIESQLYDVITESMYINYVEFYQWQERNDAIRKILSTVDSEVGSSAKTIADEVDTNIKKFLSNYNLG